MPEYRLNYFNVRGLGELVRLIFAQGGQEFTDHRFEGKDWPEEKKNVSRYPLGLAPTLEVDGKVLTESIPIARYVAGELGLVGKNNWERAWCDVIVDILKEIRKECQPFIPFYRKETDDAKFEEQKAEAFKGTIAAKLAALEGFLKSNNGGSGFFIGDGVTWADLAFIDNACILLDLQSKCLDNTPLLKALFDRVHALPNVKKHVDNRPKTSM